MAKILLGNIKGPTGEAGHTPVKGVDYLTEAEKTEMLGPLTARMDAFVALPEGSTTGDAELIDGRVDKDGVTHTNIGEHIRHVTGQLSEEIDQLSEEIDYLENTYDIVIGKNLYDKSKTIKGCYLDENGNSVANARFNLTDYIPVTNRYIISSCLVNGERSVVPSYFLTEYDSEKNKINYIASKSRITLNENTRYIRFSVDTVHDNEYMTEYGEDFSVYEPYTKKYILKPQSLPAVEQRKWLGLKWACIGDSLTEVNDKTSKHYFDYISEKTGISVQNLGVSGSGYARKQDTNQAFFQQILLTDADTDVVTIFGSFNDSSADLPYGSIDDNGTDTYYGCVNKAIDNLYSILPTVQLGIIAPTPWESVNPFTREDVENNYVKMLENVCRKRGIPFLDLYHTSGLRPWDENFKTLAYSKDNGYGVHPDETGHKIFAPRVQKFLEELLIQ